MSNFATTSPHQTILRVLPLFSQPPSPLSLAVLLWFKLNTKQASCFRGKFHLHENSMGWRYRGEFQNGDAAPWCPTPFPQSQYDEKADIVMSILAQWTNRCHGNTYRAAIGFWISIQITIHVPTENLWKFPYQWEPPWDSHADGSRGVHPSQSQLIKRYASISLPSLSFPLFHSLALVAGPLKSS